jgi:hypothetical protein
MSEELIIFRQNRLAYLRQKYNADCARLYSNLANNVNRIQKARIAVKNKQQLINSTVNQYNKDVNTLTAIFNQNNLAIEKYGPPPIIINGNKKALLIGINYTGTTNELYGCINDVESVKERITANGFKDINILTDLTSKKATRTNILLEFKNLLVNSKEGDLLFFLYSGHGSYVLDRNGDEKDGYDELIVSCDLQRILDDEFKSLIQTFLKPKVTLFAMFDSCFSGSVLDLKYQYLDSLNYEKYTENDKQLDTLGNVFMISGCTDDQTSADAIINNKASGALTWSLLESLKEKETTGNWRELIKTMRNKLKTSEFEQTPQFSSGTFVNIDEPVFI